MKKYQILIILIQTIKKQKTKHIISGINTAIITLLEFLWLNHFIYGFTYLNKQQKIILFFKHNPSGHQLICSDIKKSLNTQNLKKICNYSKNSFFILKTFAGLSNLKDSLFLKIGGFVLYKFF